MNSRTPSLVAGMTAVMLLASLGTGTAATATRTSAWATAAPRPTCPERRSSVKRITRTGGSSWPTGTIGGKKAGWANLTDTGGQPNSPAAGDRVWYDHSDVGQTRWTPCGPFGAAGTDKPTRASYDTRPGLVPRMPGRAEHDAIRTEPQLYRLGSAVARRDDALSISRNDTTICAAPWSKDTDLPINSLRSSAR